MAMDIKEMISTSVEKITKDEKTREQFLKEPVKTIEGIVGMDLPDDQINKVVEAVKAKISVDKLGGILGKLGL